MEDFLIVGGIVIVLILLGKTCPGQAPTTSIPTASGNRVSTPVLNGLIPSPRSVSGGYQVAPPSVRLGSFGQTTGWSLPSVPAPPPAAGAPPPPFWGGTAGGVGSGGNALGGSLRAGVSVGTGTSNQNASSTANVLNQAASTSGGLTFPVVIS
jgi:hypothetical protein